MQYLDYTKKRVQALLEEAAHVADSEFPYQGSRLALDRIVQFFKARRTTLDGFHPNTDPVAVKQTCSLVLRDLFTYLPFLGFILRSTNVRNAFEVFRPLLRLACDILEPGPPTIPKRTQLVLSSEWDYSPFVYSEVPELPGFVLIGIPSPESANPLLVPLAGHELGHSVWKKNKSALQRRWEPRVRQAALAAILQRWNEYAAIFPQFATSTAQFQTNTNAYTRTWAQSVTLGLRQAEESFCDFLGLRLFGWAYLEAYAYLLAPGTAGPRSPIYPRTHARIDNLLEAARTFGVVPTPGYRDLFDDSAALPLSREDAFRLEIADAARQQLVGDLIKEAEQVVVASGLPSPSEGEADEAYKRFKLFVPREKCRCLADIINGAWKAFRDPQFWQESDLTPEKRDETLKELVLKNIELFEIEQILKESP
jgi:hypothetical protein